MAFQKHLVCLTILFTIFSKSAYSEYIWNGSEWEWVTKNDYNYLYDSTEDGSGDYMDDSEGSGFDSIDEVSSRTTTFPMTTTTTTYPVTTTVPSTTSFNKHDLENSDDIVEEFESEPIKVNIKEPNEKHSILSVLTPPIKAVEKVQKILSQSKKENSMTEIQLRHENQRLKNALRKIRQVIKDLHKEISGLDIIDDIPH